MNEHHARLARALPHASRTSRGLSLFKALLALVGVSAVIGAGFLWKRSSGEDIGIDLKSAARATVKRGPMTISILQSGELAPKRSQSIKNETDRNAKIVSIIPDGTKAQKGDLLVELESQELKDNLLQRQSDLARAEADLRAAEEALAISALKYKNDLETAKLKSQIAELELKKYNEAEYPQNLDKAQVEISLAEEELTQARIKKDWTEKLVAKGFAESQELEKDSLEVKRKEIELKNKQTDLELLKEYTHKKDLQQKENDLSNARAEMERLEKTYESEKARDEANLASRKTNLEVLGRQVEKIQEQVDKTRILSEFEGQVFYPTLSPWDDRKIEEGAQVYPRQEILTFPDLSAWDIKAGAPESIIDKIKPGQKAIATIDAFPDAILHSVVETISAVPDKSNYFDSSTKTYTVKLDVTSTPSVELKPGMSVMVEIITNEIPDAIHVPLQAVSTREDRHFVYRVDGNTLKTVEVKTGEQNENDIQIVDGLKEGQELLLYAPVETGTRAGLKDSPLEKKKKLDANGEEEDVEPGV